LTFWASAVLDLQSGHTEEKSTPQERTLSRLSTGESQKFRKDNPHCASSLFRSGKKVIEIPAGCV
jgi:hypothetical protein